MRAHRCRILRDFCFNLNEVRIWRILNGETIVQKIILTSTWRNTGGCDILMKQGG